MLVTTTYPLYFGFRVRYPPFDAAKVNRLRWLLAPKRKGRFPWKMLSLMLLVALVAVIVQMYGLPAWFYAFLK